MQFVHGPNSLLRFSNEHIMDLILYLILDHQSKTLGLENMVDDYEDLSHVVGNGCVGARSARHSYDSRDI